MQRAFFAVCRRLTEDAVLKARTLTIQIARPPEDVYGFLVDPANLARWTLVRNGRPEPAAGPDSWAYDGPRGTVLVHFTPANPFMVLDYRIEAGPQTIQVAHVRVMRNGAGTVMTHTSIQQPLVSDAMFASEGEWMALDIDVLKTLMEGK
ncbi:hypothetical protein DMC47_02015 [Nostoc sp. 3335mG]|nr:hypothetical protein DMC47_02015 [Nostoc sp. 3335mG]